MSDVVQVAIISRSRSPSCVLKWKDLMLVFFDENHARTHRARSPACCRSLFFALLAACTVAALQTVGAMSRHRHGGDARRDGLSADRPLRQPDRHRRRSLGVAHSAAVGAYLSFFLDGATGGVIVSLQTLLFLARLLLRAQARPPRRRAAGRCAKRERRDGLAPTPSSSSRSPIDFMQRALLVAILVGAVCAVLSCFLVLKGWSLMGDAISHAVLPGIVLAFVTGLPLALRRLRRRALLRRSAPAISRRTAASRKTR